jgi:hypothetical protein
MKNHIETVLGTLLDYYGNFEQFSVIVGMVQAAGEKAGIVPRAQYVKDDEMANIAAAGGVLPANIPLPEHKDKHGRS